jgi:hypothetical protein
MRRMASLVPPLSSMRNRFSWSVLSHLANSHICWTSLQRGDSEHDPEELDQLRKTSESESRHLDRDIIIALGLVGRLLEQPPGCIH